MQFKKFTFLILTILPFLGFAQKELKITEQEKAVLFLMINGLSTFEIAEILCVAEGTIRGHIYNKVTKKFQMMGYEVISRSDVIEVARILGYGKKLPMKLLPYFKTNTLLLKSFN